LNGACIMVRGGGDVHYSYAIRRILGT
jgi:hypothetical protein